MKLLFKVYNNTDDSFEDIFIDVDNAKKELNGKVIRSNKGGDHYVVYSIINDIQLIEPKESINASVFKIRFLGTQIRIQNLKKFFTYVRETATELKHNTPSDQDVENLSLASLVPSYYDENIIYNSLGETDFMEYYKKFLKEEREYLLFK